MYIYRVPQARLVQRESKVTLVGREPGDRLDLQEPRDRKEERYVDIILSIYYASDQYNIRPQTFSLSSYSDLTCMYLSV